MEIGKWKGNLLGFQLIFFFGQCAQQKKTENQNVFNLFAVILFEQFCTFFCIFLSVFLPVAVSMRTERHIIPISMSNSSMFSEGGSADGSLFQGHLQIWTEHYKIACCSISTSGVWYMLIFIRPTQLCQNIAKDLQ